MKVTVDTNVFVSGLLTPHGTCGRIVDVIFAGDLTLAYDDRIWDEYQEVLHRPRLKIPEDLVGTLFAYLEAYGERVLAPPLPGSWPDPNDAMFAEVAHAAKVGALITGNKKHFPEKLTGSIRLLSPREFITFWAQRQGSTKGA